MDTQTQPRRKHKRESYQKQPPQDLQRQKCICNIKAAVAQQKNATRTNAQTDPNTCTSTYFTTPRAPSCPSHTLKNAQEKEERLSASRYEFRVSCITQEPLRGQSSALKAELDLAGASLWSTYRTPETRTRSRKAFFFLGVW